jgi:hypothetical protein
MVKLAKNKADWLNLYLKLLPPKNNIKVSAYAADMLSF